MTKEELKQEFEKYLKDSADYYDPREPLTERKLLQMWLDCAEPREKRIAELEEKLANADYQLEGRDLEIKELKEQIEKIKCCVTCENCDEFGNRFNALKVCRECVEHSNWQLKGLAE